MEDSDLNFSSNEKIPEKRVSRNTKKYMSLPFNPNLKDRAKALRKAGNLAEVLFWKKVKSQHFKGYDFDRQKIVGNYIVDFYCSNCQVVIEIDGSSHIDKEEYDAERDAYLIGLGLKVIHIQAEDVLGNVDSVIEVLHGHVAFGPPRPSGTSPMEVN